MSMPLPKSLSINTRDLKGEAIQPEVTIMKPMKADDVTLSVNNIDSPELDKSGQARVWLIQVASFAKPKNAIAMRNELRDAGYKAFEKLAQDGVHTRVFVGPSLQRSSLEQKLAAINKRFEVKGKLLPYLGR